MNIDLVDDCFYLPELREDFEYFDVQYISPAGGFGIHSALMANDIEDAAKRSPIMLCYGTNYHPTQFKVVSVKLTEEHNKPK